MIRGGIGILSNMGDMPGAIKNHQNLWGQRMPAIALNRSNAWTYWSKGLISATNMDSGLLADFPSTQDPLQHMVLHNLAIKRGHNAIRLWLGWAGPYTLNEEDVTAVSVLGWGSTEVTHGSQANGASLTYADVKVRLQAVLDTCERLGMGVILVLNYGQGSAEGDLWNPASNYKINLARFWQKTYESFGVHNALIGFDLVNEPNPKQDGPAYNFAAMRDDPFGWPQIAQSVVNKIRATEATVLSSAAPSLPPLPLIVEGVYSGGINGLGVFDDGGPTPFLNDPQNRIVYSFHYYDPPCFTGQGIGEGEFEALGTPYPMPGFTMVSYWLDGKDTYELRQYQKTDQIADDVRAVAKFKRDFNVPIFVGEFSAGQPRLAQVYPQGQAQFDQLTSTVQNTVASKSRLLNRLATITKPTGFGSNPSDPTRLTVDEAYQVAALYRETKRRWITSLEVSPELNLVATMGHTVAEDEFNTGFHVSVSPDSYDSLTEAEKSDPKAWFYNWKVSNEQRTAKNDKMRATPNAQIVTSYSDAGQTVFMRGKDYAVPSKPVTLYRHATQINFGRAPAGLNAGDKVEGLQITVPDVAPDGQETTLTITLPVALLWLESSLSGDQIDGSRFNFMRDTLYTWQTLGFSWAWHADDVNGAGGHVMWRPSKQMGELLASAASGARLAKRN